MFGMLVVEDELIERRVILHLLGQRENELNVFETNSGPKALDILRREHIDILLTDIQMPMMDGFTLAEEARKLLPELSIIFFTCHDDFSYIKRALGMKAVNYILKPVDPAEFHATLTEVIERLRSRQTRLAADRVQGLAAQNHMLHMLLNGTELRHLEKRYPQMDFTFADRLCRMILIRCADDGALKNYLSSGNIMLDLPEGSHVLSPESGRAVVLLPISEGFDTLPADIRRRFEACTNVPCSTSECAFVPSPDDMAAVYEEISEKAAFESSAGCLRDSSAAHSLHAVRQYIHHHYNDDLSLEVLAAEAHVSKGYLSRLFAAEYGCGLSKYIKNIRMEKAKEFLRSSSLHVNEIAARVGYSTDSYFCKSFVREFGMTPEQYRNQAAEGKDA